MTSIRHGPEADPRRAACDGGQDGGRVVGAQHDARLPDRFLERLEQRVLGVGVEAVCRLDDGDPEPRLHGQQREL